MKDGFEIVAVIVTIPTIAAATGAWCANRKRPRRRFWQRGHRVAAFFIGLCAAAAALAATAGIYYWLPPKGPNLVLSGQSIWVWVLRTPPVDGVILAGLAAASGWLAVRLLGGRIPAGLCRTCGYDITGSIGFGSAQNAAAEFRAWAGQAGGGSRGGAALIRRCLPAPCRPWSAVGVF